MNNKVLTGLIITVLGAPSAFATQANNYDLERRIFDVSYQLTQVSDANNQELCAGDVLIAAAYLHSAGRELQHQNRDKALVSLAYGHNELKEISSVRSYCAPLSAKIKPYLAQVILIKSELDNEPPPAPDETSD